MVDPAAPHFEGIRNIRDLGGLVTADGRRVIHRRLFRSGSLHTMTDSDRRTLEDLGVRHVFDLRSAWEREQHPTVWPGVRVVETALVDEHLVESITTRLMAGEIPNDELADWWTLTRVFDAPDLHAPMIRRIFEELAALDPDQGVLFHCRGGKDRTGMLASLVLYALGVEWDEIVADFMMSNAPLDPDDPSVMLREAGIDTISDDAKAAIVGVREEWLVEMMDRITRRDGSIDTYVEARLGLDADRLEHLRTRYLTAAH